MANARLTFGALLNSVTAVAGIVTTAADATADAAQYGGNFIANALEEQRMRIADQRIAFADNLADETAQSIALRAVEAKKFCDQSAFHEEQYMAARERIEAARSAAAKK